MDGLRAAVSLLRHVVFREVLTCQGRVSAEPPLASGHSKDLHLCSIHLSSASITHSIPHVHCSLPQHRLFSLHNDVVNLIKDKYGKFMLFSLCC